MQKNIMGTRPNFEIPPKPAQKEVSTLAAFPNTEYISIPLPVPPCGLVPAAIAESDTRTELGVKSQQSEPVITLRFVRETIKKKSMRYLPGYVPFAVLEDFIQLFVSKWATLCLRSFAAAERLLKDHVEELCVEFFNRFESSGLLQEVKAVVLEVIRKMADRTRDQINLICELENNRPFTLSHEHFVDSRGESMIEFAHHRNQNNPSACISRTSHTIRDGTGNFRSISQNEVADDVLLGHLCARGYPISDLKQLALLHGPDEYDTELSVISDVWAYFEISSTRIIDIMPMLFEVVFARDFGRELRDVLTSKLNLVGKQGERTCARVTRDAEDVHVRRVKLTEDKGILSQALQILGTS